MKKLPRLLLLSVLFTFAVAVSHAAPLAPNPVPVENMTDAQKEARVDQIKERLSEIMAMDRSQMSKAERKELKTEVKELKNETKSLGNRTILLPIMSVLILVFVLIVLL